jgi:hypothetical protein
MRFHESHEMMFLEEPGPPLTHKTAEEDIHVFVTQASLCVKREKPALRSAVVWIRLAGLTPQSCQLNGDTAVKR